MAIIRKWDGIGVADGALTAGTVGTGDNAFVVSGSPTVVSEQINIPDIATISYARWNDLNLGAFAIRFYFQLNGPVDGTTYMLYFYDTGGSRLGGFAISSGRQVSLRNAAGSAVSTSAAITEGNIYRCETWKASGNTTAQFRLYNADNSTHHTGSGSFGTANNLDDVQFGRQSSTQFGPARYFNLAVGDTNEQIGAYTPPAPSGPEWFLWTAARDLSIPLEDLGAFV